MLIHADHFDAYGTSIGNAIGIYAGYQNNVSLATDPDTVSTQRCLYLAADPSRINSLRYAPSAAAATFGFAARFWLTELPTNYANLTALYFWKDSNNSEIGRLVVTTTGSLQLWLFDSTIGNIVAVAETPGPVVTAGAWWHVETKMTASGVGAGSFEVRVEGISKLTYTGFTTKSLIGGTLGTISQMEMASIGDGSYEGPGLYVKDFVIWNTSGSLNNNFMGRVKVYRQEATSDDTLTMTITGGQATGTAVLNNNPADNTKYLVSNVADIGNMNIFNMEDLPTTVSAVKGVFTVVRAGKEDSGDGSFQAGIKSTSSSSMGTDRNITQSQAYWFDLFETDPDTSAAWTRSAVNAAKLQFKRTA